MYLPIQERTWTGCKFENRCKLGDIIFLNSIPCNKKFSNYQSLVSFTGFILQSLPIPVCPVSSGRRPSFVAPANFTWDSPLPTRSSSGTPVGFTLFFILSLKLIKQLSLPGEWLFEWITRIIRDERMGKKWGMFQTSHRVSLLFFTFFFFSNMCFMEFYPYGFTVPQCSVREMQFPW